MRPSTTQMRRQLHIDAIPRNPYVTIQPEKEQRAQAPRRRT